MRQRDFTLLSDVFVVVARRTLWSHHFNLLKGLYRKMTKELSVLGIFFSSEGLNGDGGGITAITVNTSFFGFVT